MKWYNDVMSNTQSSSNKMQELGKLLESLMPPVDIDNPPCDSDAGELTVAATKDKGQ